MSSTNNNQLAIFRNKEELIKKYGAEDVDLAVKYLFVTDTEADKMAEYIRKDASKKARKLFNQAVDSGIDSVENPPKVMRDYFRQAENLPEWVDWSQLERGAIAVTKSLLLGPLAITVNLGATYVSHQAQTLALTGNLQKRAEGRMVESTIFFSKIFKPGNMKPGSDGFKEAMNIRLIHAFARSHVKRSPEHDESKTGAVINQYDTACGQYYYFSTLFFNSGEKFGLTFSYQEKTDIYALWRYICYLMGVPDVLLAKSVEDAENKANLLMDTFDPTDDSRALLKALVENTPIVDAMFLNKIFPKPMADKFIRDNHYIQFKYAAFRLVLGEEMADKMAIPKSNLYRYAVRAYGLLIMASYRSVLKRQVKKIDNVNKMATIGEGLIEEYYRITKAQVGPIDNA